MSDTLSSIVILAISFSAISIASFSGTKNSSTTDFQFAFPSSILSNLLSISAVNSTSTICLKYSLTILLTINPNSVGNNTFFSLSTYFLLNKVVIVGA